MDPEEFFSEDEDKELELTENQWKLVLDTWNSRKNNPPSIQELTKLVFNKPNLDGRSREGKAIRRKLAGLNIKAKTTLYKASPLPELSNEDKEYIQNNYTTLKTMEMAETIFKKPLTSPLCKEAKVVIEYVKTLDPNNSFENLEDVVNGPYVPPKSFNGALEKINKYRHQPIEKDKVTGKQRKDINSLWGYMNTYRFNVQINKYKKIEDRNLFESTFIRYCYDKFDLSETEVDQYILLASEVVSANTIQERIARLNGLLDEASEDEDKAIKMSLVEAINTSQEDYNKCLKTQKDLLGSLTVSRSKKESEDKGGQASILNLVQMWKEEESRVKMLKYAQKRKEIFKKGVEEIMSMDELVARVAGISIDEILNG